MQTGARRDISQANSGDGIEGDHALKPIAREAAQGLTTPSNITAAQRDAKQEQDDRFMMALGFTGKNQFFATTDGGDQQGLVQPREKVSAQAERQEKRANVPTEQEKKIDGLIESLGDKSFHARQKAQEELVKIGWPAYEQLEKSKVDPRLDVARRSEEAQKAILRADPTAPARQVRDNHTAGLAEIAKDGKISAKTDEEQQKLIKLVHGMTMDKPEFALREPDLEKTAGDSNASREERIEARRKLAELRAMHRIGPGDQAQLDYADMLFRSGDKDKAAQVLGKAIQGNPDLHRTESFRLLAMDSDAVKNKGFSEILDKATGLPDLAKQWIANKPLFDRVSHLGHDLDRHGPTEDMVKRSKDLLDPGKEKTGWWLKEKLVDTFTNAGNSKEATKLMTQLIKEDPMYLKADWMKTNIHLNRSNSDAEFSQAAKAAEKKLAP